MREFNEAVENIDLITGFKYDQETDLNKLALLALQNEMNWSSRTILKGGKE